MTIKETKRTSSKRFVEPYRINQYITASEVRIVGDNMQVGVYCLAEALHIAKGQELDLVEISPNTDPPVCKIIDYQKFKYEQRKKQRKIKAKAQKVIIKEIRFSPNTDDHDFQFKLRHAINFLKEGARVKAYVKFTGRQIVFKERGELLLLKFAQVLEEYGKVEQLPQLEGKYMVLSISPKSTK